MELQQKEGYSPLSGCLPLLIQLPIIILLYNVIQNPLSYIADTTDKINDYNDNYKDAEYVVVDDNILGNYSDLADKEDAEDRKEIEREHIVAALGKHYKLEEGEFDEIDLIDAIIEDINSATGEEREQKIAVIESFGIVYDSIPRFELFGINLAKTPSFKDKDNLILIIIPVLAAASSWLSMWLTRRMNKTGLQTDQDAQVQASMKIMDLVMPLMTLFIAFNFSGMLGMYWILQSVLGLGQSFILSRAMPLPKYTEDELKEMQRQRKEVEKAQRQAAKLQPKHRSLHYIDEDDYDTLPEVKSQGNNNKPKGNGLSGGAPEIKD